METHGGRAAELTSSFPGDGSSHGRRLHNPPPAHKLRGTEAGRWGAKASESKARADGAHPVGGPQHPWVAPSSRQPGCPDGLTFWNR